jgi:conjugal transfer pilus assembly protein TraI
MPAQTKTSQINLPGTRDSGFLAADPGIPALPVGALLETHRVLIDRIKLCFGMDRVSFDQSVMPLLTRYAATVHLLPCTADNFFSAPGGLLRIGLETAFYALQGTDAHIFSGRATISERTRLEPRWRRATFIAGLCCELHRAFGQAVVTGPQGDEWTPYLVPLASWLRQHGIERYFLKWQPQVREHRALGLFALPFVVTAEDLQDLDAGRSVIVPHMLAAIAGTTILRDPNIVEALVRRALALVIDCELRLVAQRTGKLQSGPHLERYLIEALRHLAASLASWRVNTEKSRLWYGADGMFLIWPNAFEDLGKHFEASELPGIPRAPGEILEILLAAGLLVPHEQDCAQWGIYPPGATSRLDAVRLASAEMLFANTDEIPEPLSVALLKPSVAPPPISKRASGTTARPTQPVRAVSPAANAKPTAQGGECEQLSLLGEVEPKPVQQCKLPEEPSPVLPSTVLPCIKPALKAPLRLPFAFRQALEGILKSFEAGSESEAVLTGDGLFVPLSAFKARKLEAPLALRTLNEVGMLAEPSPVTRAFRGGDASGVLIAHQFIQRIPRKDGEDADSRL